MEIGLRKLDRRYLIVGAAALIWVGVIFSVMTLWSSEWWRDTSYGRKADGIHWRISVSLAQTALALFAITLSIGPYRRLRGLTTPTHLPWRRATGLTAAIVAWVHVVFGITIHAPGWRIWSQFGQLGDQQFLKVLFSVAVWLGLSAAVVLVPLVATSNSAALRRFGARPWKRIQRLSYVVLILVAGHVFAVQYQERRSLVQVGWTFSVIGLIVTLQLAGVIVTRRQSRATGPAATG